jgi:hypothetical protein
MKKWEKADIKCISISETRFDPVTSADQDGGYVGEGVLGGIMEAKEEFIEEGAESVEEFFYEEATDFLS